MHIHLPDTRMYATIFVHQSFSQNRVFQVCLRLALLMLVIFHEVPIAASSTSLWLLIVPRVTLSRVAFGLPACFFLPVALFQDFDYFPLSFPTSNYLVAKGVQFLFFWTYEIRFIHTVCHMHSIQTTKIYSEIISSWFEHGTKNHVAFWEPYCPCNRSIDSVLFNSDY